MTTKNGPTFSEYRLTRWRRVTLLRETRRVEVSPGEFRRMSFCPMCAMTMPTWRLQVHHIRPKSVYPDKAYLISNAIALCLGCHMSIVHGGNSFQDMKHEHHWRFFVPSFDRYVSLAKNKAFAEKWQARVWVAES